MILAELGAEVIRVAREWGRPFDHNKKSIQLNLKHPDGAEIFKKLTGKSDVVLNNYAPGVMESFGLGYDDLKKVNPNIVYCQISGYGLTGPDRKLRAFDKIIQGRSGVMNLTGPVGDPAYVGVAISDFLGSLNAAIAIIAAFRFKEKTGKGQMIDISMLDSTIGSIMVRSVNECLIRGERIIRVETAGNKKYGCKDGHIMLTILGHPIWERFCKLIGKEEYFILMPEGKSMLGKLGTPEGDSAEKIITEWLSNKTCEEALESLNKAGITAGPIYTIQDVAKDPQIRSRLLTKAYHPDLEKEVEVIGSQFKMSETPGVVDRVFPVVGGDTEEVLTTLLNYSKEEVVELRKKGVLKGPSY
jgi:crotonobetainyl-CoA:carnitine CoA-transferase CaiB-like acyl-CoA transferase